MDQREGEEPDDVPATGSMVPVAGTQKALAILFFETKGGYNRGDAVLSTMLADDTLGAHPTIAKYDVAVRTSVAD